MDAIPKRHNPRGKLINELNEKRQIYIKLLKLENEDTEKIIRRILDNIETTIRYMEDIDIYNLEKIIRKNHV